MPRRNVRVSDVTSECLVGGGEKESAVVGNLK
jgi:hypothetical protein